MHLFHKLQSELGIEIDFVDCDAFIDAINDSNGRHKLCYLETPTNPTLKIVDIKGVGDAAQSAGIPSMIDSTFGSPINQRPHELGIDVVMHSATKYLGGHSDIIAGSISTNSEMMTKIRSAAKLLGEGSLRLGPGTVGQLLPVGRQVGVEEIADRSAECPLVLSPVKIHGRSILVRSLFGVRGHHSPLPPMLLM